MSERRVLIIGLGLIGGSLGLALQRLGHVHVLGADLASVVASHAARATVHEAVSADDGAALDAALTTADVAVLAAPTSVIRATLPRALDRARVVTDCGSTKRSIVQVARQHARAGRFVPGHPMAGHPSGGAENASADLFRGKSWLLCPDGTDDDALATVRDLLEGIGAEVIVTSAARHDAAVALTSHAVQLIASALSALALERGDDFAGGPAFARATRVAGGPEAIWRDIFADNGDAIADALGVVLNELSAVREALGAGKTTEALELLARARVRANQND